MIDILVNNTELAKDTIVDLLPFVLIEIRNYTNQYFLTKTHAKINSIEDGIITLSNEINGIQQGDTVEFLNSENNTLVYQIKTVDGNKVTVEQTIVDETFNDNMVLIKLSFKNVNIKTIINMLKYENEFGQSSGIKSQSLGGYSVTYSTPDSGDTAYPVELYGGVKSLRKINDDYAEYRRKGYVRL